MQLQGIARKVIPASRLQKLLHYDCETGIWHWKVNHSRKSMAGCVAGNISDMGYRRIMVDGRLYQAARLAWFYVTGKWPVHEIDHIDGNQSNDRLSNLRTATRAENACNQRKYCNNTTGYKGVQKLGTRYRAKIRCGGKQVCLGRFSTLEEAASAYNDAALRLHGKFSCLNEMSTSNSVKQ